MAGERVQRRLAAILAADVVGYSRLMGEDEAGTLTKLKELRATLIDPAVAEYRGRVVKLMGDGALVEFASVIDAVECAVDIQQKMAKRNGEAPDSQTIAFRIGINLGDVIIDGDDIYGDGINVAARLEELSEKGSICVSGTVFDQVKGKLAWLFDDIGPQTVKNIAAPVRAYRWQSGLVRATTSVVPEATAKSSQDLHMPDKPSIAVLPFDNMSGDLSGNAEEDYFADGILEDIITELSRFSDLFVIARNSSFQYKGRAIDVRQVGRELGVRYVLEGSVRRIGSRVRIAAQLIDALTRGHLWAEKFDYHDADILALQDQIAESVVAAIAPEILAGEGRRAARESPANLGAFDCCMRGMWHSHQLGPEGSRQAESWLRRSIELDPTLARAHMMLSRVLSVRCWAGYSDDIERDLQASQVAAERALALDDRDAASHYALSILSLMTRRHERALAAAQRAIDLNPNFALGYFALGETRVFMGDFAETLDPMMRCLRLTPRDPYASLYVSLIALAHYHLGNYKEAIRYSEQALQRRRIYVVLRTLAATLGQLGRTEEARSLLTEMEQMKLPVDVARHWELTCPYANPVHEGHLVEGLRKAGWTGKGNVGSWLIKEMPSRTHSGRSRGALTADVA